MQLEMFVAVVEEDSVQKAAERVFRTQPAVSLALTKLERRVGAPLLERRRGSRRRLTPAGQLLYEYAARIVALRDEALSRVRGEATDCAGCVRVGVSGPAALPWFSRLAVAFAERHPRVRVEMHCDCPAKLLRDLRQWNIHFALLTAQHEIAGAGDLVVIPVTGSGRECSFWMIRRRLGNSELMMRLEDFLISQPGEQSGECAQAIFAIADRVADKPGAAASQRGGLSARRVSTQLRE